MGKQGLHMRDYRGMIVMRLEIVSEMYKRGYTLQKIRDEVMARLRLETYSLQTVHKDVQRLLKEWRSYRLTNIDDSIQLELERLRDLQREAWEAWEKSKKDYDRNRLWRHGVPASKDTKNSKDNSMQTTHVTQQTENVVNCGDPRFLEIVYKCGVEIRKILGLYAPEKRELTGKDGKDLNPILQVEIIDSKEQLNDENTDNEDISQDR